jgi:ABC-2 type transport system ATP-binding protein
MNDTNENIVSVKGLYKSFGSHAVLEGLNLEAARGEVVGILGRNGTGKTTLFKILLDLIASDQGSVRALGLSPDGGGKLRGLIGYVPEKPAFHDFMRVEEVLQFRAKLFPRWDMAKALELCKKLELDTKARTKDLSKGNTAKLAWIAAVAHNPELLLLDEPTSGLDYLVRDHILSGLVNELADGGKTIIIANHRMGEMGGILDKVCLLKGGVIDAVYDADFLKTETFRVSVRLENSVLQEQAGVKLLSRSGNLAELAVFGRKNMENLKTGAEVQPMDLDTVFKALLGD